MTSSPRRAFADYGCCGCCLLTLTWPLVGIVGASEWIDQTFFSGHGDSIPYSAFGLILMGIVALALISKRRRGKEPREDDTPPRKTKPEPGNVE